jgi:hypothetical protein
LLSFLSLALDKLVFVEFHGTWYASCQAFYSELCYKSTSFLESMFLLDHFNENESYAIQILVGKITTAKVFFVEDMCMNELIQVSKLSIVVEFTPRFQVEVFETWLNGQLIIGIACNKEAPSEVLGIVGSTVLNSTEGAFLYWAVTLSLKFSIFISYSTIFLVFHVY